MALPDAISLKNGSFSHDEWDLVKEHPRYAKIIVGNIPFLKPALDIPFAARIFAVVAVWDALVSDRPYRRAWPEDKAREYIHDQSGKLFDPQVVEAFLEFVEGSKHQGSSG